MGNTTHLYRYAAGAWALANQVYFWDGAAWQPASRIWRWDPTNKWVMVYSTPVIACSPISGSNSGLAVSGTVTSSAASTSISGGFSGSASYAWTYVSGDAGITCSNAASSSPTFTKTATSGTSGVWKVSLTDTITGATSNVNVTITLTWTNTESPIAVTGNNGAGLLSTSTGPISGTVSTGTGGAAGGCSPSGGSGSYTTYAWVYFSGDSGIGINNSAIQNPTWSKSMSASAGTQNSTSAVWQVTVTDSEGHTAIARPTMTLTIRSDQPALAVGSWANPVGYDYIDFDSSGNVCNNVQNGDGPGFGGQVGGVFPTGGNGSYTYSWARINGDVISIIAGSTSASPTWSNFQCSHTGSETTTGGVWRCTFSDTSGQGPLTQDVTVVLTIYLAND